MSDFMERWKLAADDSHDIFIYPFSLRSGSPGIGDCHQFAFHLIKSTRTRIVFRGPVLEKHLENVLLCFCLLLSFLLFVSLVAIALLAFLLLNYVVGCLAD